MELATFVQTLANSLVLGSIYALVAIGLSLAFGVMRMANFAHGEFYMVGAYVVYALYALAGWPFYAAVAVAVPVVAVLGMLTERLIFRPTKSNTLAGFMATAGLAFILQVLAGQIWGVGLAKQVPMPIVGATEIFGALISTQRLTIIPIAFATLAALWVFLYRTKWGRGMRACSIDPDAAALQGIDIRKMSLLTMGLSGASAGLAGALMSPIYSVTPYMGHGVVLIAFIVVIIGGMASVEGAVAAAFIIGFVHTFGTTIWDGITATMLGVAFMAVILVIRPQGLFGQNPV
ncbi:High-affinity branched-chain amino acid transport system permease protein LivH [Roseovarius aestuarii]|uniref:High-affinity branched-chain amino acid transport system permease protein LivH n=2 Tax=Roseovarius aestuarii TaxID=475083 RepID=A0A1X7BNR6_9RHOB|nr:High-affinity branched-chain amino acid transport system permease protein LivH [Roseovarius aestuarii]